jgi:conjugal transfer/type IV secretion protein DotA/TraY
MLIVFLLLLVAGPAGAISRTAWNVDDWSAPPAATAAPAAISGERGILDTVAYRPYAPGAYVAPAIPATATGGWTPAAAGNADGGSAIMGTDAVKLIEDASESIGMNDWGRILFRDMFGLDWAEVLDNATTATTPGTSESVLLSLLYGLNIVALAVVACILAYSIVMGGVGTAHEGTPMGKGMHTIMTPVRSALAVAYLAPTLKGLSILQVLLLAGFAWSCSFSNYLWGGMLDYMHANGGQLVTQLPTDAQQKIDEIGRTALQGLAVQAWLHSFAGEDLDGPPATGKIVSSSFFAGETAGSDWLEAERQKGKITKIQVLMSKPPATKGVYGLENYGLIQINCDSQSGSGRILCAAHNSAVEGLVNDLVPIARDLVASLHPASGVTGPPQAAYQQALQRYQQRLVAAYPAVVTDGNDSFQAGLDGFVAQARADGWLSAGSYYWTLARYNQGINDQLGDYPQTVPITATERHRLPPEVAVLFEKIENYAGKTDNSAEVARSSARDDGAFGGFMAMISAAMQTISIDAYIHHLADDGDPLATLAGMGHGIIGATEVLLSLYYAAVAAAGAAEGAADSVAMIPLVGTAVKALAGTPGPVLAVMAWLVHSCAGLMFICGAFLAYYLPAVPFLLFLFGAVGLVLSVTEMVFAAPIWAAAHAIPGGEGFAGQYGRQGYMLYFAVLLRAPLMLCGFFVGILAFNSLSRYAAKALKVYIAGAQGSSAFGLVTMAAFVVLIAIVYVSLAQKAFSLTTHIAERALGWIGGGSSSFGESNETKMLIGAAVATSSRMVPTGRGGGGSRPAAAKPAGTAPATARGDDQPGVAPAAAADPLRYC